VAWETPFKVFPPPPASNVGRAILRTARPTENMQQRTDDVSPQIFSFSSFLLIIAVSTS